uniref:Uncharacterized protein n=1 Tax=Setaria digitata TaxID=48799 RepID=A0A915PF52_9BILA
MYGEVNLGCQVCIDWLPHCSLNLFATDDRVLMIADNYPPPKYEEIVKNENNESTVTDATTPSAYPSSLPALTSATITNINESITSAVPFHVNLISSTSPVFGPYPIETDCPYCQVCM